MYTLVWTASFTRSARKFAKAHPELRERFAAVLRDLEKDPFQPHLKYDHIHGQLAGMQAVSITYSYRITLTVLVTEREVILLDVGTHDEVYR